MHPVTGLLLASSLVVGPGAGSAHPDPILRFDGCGPNDKGCEPAPRYTAGDWIGSILLGDVGMAAGGAIGFGIGYAAAGSCSDDGDSDSFLGDCFLHGIGEGALGGFIVGTAGLAGGVYAFNEARGHRGSYWAALGGGTLGTLAAGGLMAASTEGDVEGLGVLAALTLPALGATLGYYLSRDTSPRYEPLSGALLDVGGDGVVRLGVPNVSLARGLDATAVGVTLLGGAF